MTKSIYYAYHLCRIFCEPDLGFPRNEQQDFSQYKLIPLSGKHFNNWGILTRVKEKNDLLFIFLLVRDVKRPIVAVTSTFLAYFAHATFSKGHFSQPLDVFKDHWYN